MKSVVIKKGTFIRQVWGPFTDSCHAARFADHRSTQEPDDYHTFEVHTLDTTRGIDRESKPAYSCKGQPSREDGHLWYELERGSLDGL